MINLTENLNMVHLYASNQGDKFHLFSDEVEGVIESELTEEQKAVEVEALADTYADKFSFHATQVRNYLNWDDEAE